MQPILSWMAIVSVTRGHSDSTLPLFLAPQGPYDALTAEIWHPERSVERYPCPPAHITTQLNPGRGILITSFTCLSTAPSSPLVDPFLFPRARIGRVPLALLGYLEVGDIAITITTRCILAAYFKE